MKQPAEIPSERRVVEGWGRFPRRNARVIRITRPSDAERALKGDAAGLSRGAGRSYGDSASAEVVWDLTPLKRILFFDEANAEIEAEAGLTLGELLEFTVPKGLFLYVTPGTREITLGGGVAADVHGKSHHLHGSFADHVTAFTLLTPDGRKTVVKPGSPLFDATAGGMGLTGAILSVRLRLLRIPTSWVLQRQFKASNLKDLMALFEEHASSPYTVAWVDASAKGDSLGRGFLTVGDFAPLAELRPSQRRAPLRVHRKPRLTLPDVFPSGLLSSFALKILSTIYFHLPRPWGRSRVKHYESFFHPLDAIGNWNRSYGKRGFVQYQFVLPPEESEAGLREVLAKCVERGRSSFVTVLKKFGEGSKRPLSFPRPGWILCLDFAVDAKLEAFLVELDEIVLARRGRFYLAKDARVTPERFLKAYPELDAFRKTIARIDPEGRSSSDQSRRLGYARPRRGEGR